MRTCDLCDKPHRARGLCSAHWKQKHGKDAKMRAACCTGCGTSVERERPGRNGSSTFCSPLCRHWIRWGAWSSRLPTRHAALPQPPKVEVQRRPILELECQWCGTAFETNQPASRYCSKQCAKRRAKVTRRAAEHSAPGMYTFTEIMRLYLKQGRRCAYCMLTIDGLPDPEHVIPLSRGGRNDTSNMVAACRLCNSDKGDLTLHEWAVDRERRGLPAVRTVLDSAEYNHLLTYPVTTPAWRHRENTRSIAA